MLYLENVLEDWEQVKLLNFADEIGMRINDLCCYPITAATRMFNLDIIKLDEQLGKAIEEYDKEACKYKGKPASMNDVIRIRFSPEMCDIISRLL